MFATAISITGLALDILGVLLLLVTTSKKYIEAALMVKAIDDGWITISNEEGNRWLAQTKRAMIWYRRMYRIAIGVIVVGFLLQIVGHLLWIAGSYRVVKVAAATLEPRHNQSVDDQYLESAMNSWGGPESHSRRKLKC